MTKKKMWNIEEEILRFVIMALIAFVVGMGLFIIYFNSPKYTENQLNATQILSEAGWEKVCVEKGDFEFSSCQIKIRDYDKISANNCVLRYTLDDVEFILCFSGSDDWAYLKTHDKGKVLSCDIEKLSCIQWTWLPPKEAS